jgi:hypothetical protein
VPIIIYHNKYDAILLIDVLVPTNVRNIYQGGCRQPMDNLSSLAVK